MLNLKNQIIKQMNILDKKAQDIDNDAPIFGEGLGLDSIDALELVVILENEYGITVQEAQELSPHFESIRKLATFVQKERKL